MVVDVDVVFVPKLVSTGHSSVDRGNGCDIPSELGFNNPPIASHVIRIVAVI
uniref:Uncharacterized protein n=1 Tax=Ciona intestinalis TaxID=7719 RepID=H2XVH1_CIOIN